MVPTNEKVSITVCDRLRTEHCVASRELLELILAGLSGDGETIEELRGGVKRFQEEHDAEVREVVWLAGVAAAGRGAQGWILIDLPARVIVCEGLGMGSDPFGRIRVWSGTLLKYVEVPYRWSGKWKWIAGGVEGMTRGWGELVERRRRQRWQQLVTDVRAVLFGRNCSEFVVAATRQLRRDRKEQGKWDWGGWNDREPDTAEQLGVDRGVYGETEEVYSAREYAVVRDLHAQWLLTTRHDLQGRTPREVMLEESARLRGDMEDRRCQWVMTGKCPAPIPQASYAYRYGGIGPQEGVMHQRMMRYLLERVWFDGVDPWRAQQEGFLLCFSEAVERVEEIKREWLSRVQPDELDGYSPLAVIDLERQRIPITSRDGSGEPVFLMLSKWSDEDEFVFSECALYEDWKRRVNGIEAMDQAESFVPQPMRDEIWENSYVVPEVNQMSPSVRVFTGFLGFASHIQELGQNLRESRCDANLALPLAEHLENLRDVCRDNAAWRIDTVVEDFCESLEELEREAPTLRLKCRSFQQRLRAFADDAQQFLRRP